MIDPGTVLDGRYSVVRLIGEGAMGAVYEAEHTVVGQHVAIKVLHPHFARIPGAVARFQREARAAAEIGHPNIVEVLDSGTHRESPFLVMEMLRGETLGERRSRLATLPTQVACGIVGHMLSALAAAHARGIVHRDVKPDNVFLAERGGREVLKLLDFGVSKFRREGGLQDTTQEGLPIGTPAYMAPEQWMGRKDIDHRADLFAVGVILYELITGGLPFEGDSQSELFLEIVRGTEEPPPPSEIAPGVPSRINAVVRRALLRDRAARFQTAQDFLAALRPFLTETISVVDAVPMPVADARSSTPTGNRRVVEKVPTRVDGLFDRSRSRRPLVVAALSLAAIVGVGVTLRARTSSTPAATALRPVVTAAPPPAAPPPIVSATPPSPPVVSPSPPPPSAAPTAVSAAAAAPRAPSVRPRTAARRAPVGIGALRLSREF